MSIIRGFNSYQHAMKLSFLNLVVFILLVLSSCDNDKKQKSINIEENEQGQP
jgi:hypothetical protein